MYLSDVPHQPLILRDTSRTKRKQGGSKYQGVSFHKATKKWQTTIRIEGKLRHIGYYESEEEAAADHARAAFKYCGQGVQETNMSQLSEPSDSSKNDRTKEELTTSTDDKMYYVEAIVAHRRQKKSRHCEYLIQWEGYTQKTWEPESNLHPESVEEYWEGLK